MKKILILSMMATIILATSCKDGYGHKIGFELNSMTIDNKAQKITIDSISKFFWICDIRYTENGKTEKVHLISDENNYSVLNSDWFTVSNKHYISDNDCYLIIDIKENDTGKERDIYIDVSAGNSSDYFHLTQMP